MTSEEVEELRRQQDPIAELAEEGSGTSTTARPA
jgi:hypothetical protein